MTYNFCSSTRIGFLTHSLTVIRVSGKPSIPYYKLHSHSTGHLSWRKLGDVTRSIFALGYHERVENNTPAPAFLKHLRQAAFARVYSPDKNVSIFFGRPPRIHQKYRCLDLLRYRAEAHPDHNQHDDPRQYSSWDIDDKFDYMADTR